MTGSDRYRDRRDRDWLAMEATPPPARRPPPPAPAPRPDGDEKDGDAPDKAATTAPDGKDAGHKAKEEQPQDKPQKKEPEKKDDKLLPLWPFVVAGLVVLVFVALVLWLIFRPRPDVWTDDAYVTVHYASIAPRVSGQVSAVLVDDNQAVKAGDVLVTLDPRDFQTALASAEAALARDTAQVGDVSANQERQPATIAEREADVASATARLGFADADARRFNNLAATGAGTQQQRQQADSTLAQNRAALDSAKAALDAARKQLDVLAAQKKASEATVEADRAQVRQAELNLSYTRITAPLDGTVGERAVQVGNTVAPGATLMTVVPLDRAYIRANYRELDLAHVRSGQAVTVHVDAYDIDLDGTVDSVAPASGASFAPIQPNNATGNFTKIVQRLPVKVVVAAHQPLARLLKVGFSVETTIHTGLEDVVAQQRASSTRITDH